MTAFCDDILQPDIILVHQRFEGNRRQLLDAPNRQ